MGYIGDFCFAIFYLPIVKQPISEFLEKLDAIKSEIQILDQPNSDYVVQSTVFGWSGVASFTVP